MKASEIRELTMEEINHKLDDLTEELFNLRFQKAKSLLENKHRIRMVKKDVARLKTIITEKENEVGK